MNGLENAKAMFSDDGEPPLAFEQWREIAPRLSRRTPDERVALLRAAGVEAEHWERADGFWSLTLAAECARGDRTRAEDFGRACAALVAPRSDELQAETEDTLPEATAPATPPPPMLPLPELTVPTFLRPATGLPEVAPLAVAAPIPALVGRAHATIEVAPFALAPGRTALPFATAPADAPPAFSGRPVTLPAQSGATLDLTAALAEGSLGVQAIEGRDRRTEAGTVELDPDMLAAFFADKRPR